VRLRSVVPSDIGPLPEEEREESNARPAAVGQQQIYIEGRWVPGLVYEREKLKSGDIFSGPAIVTEYTATTFVPPGCRVEVDRLLNMVIDVHAD
jgi:N-methylhydantoinase A